MITVWHLSFFKESCSQRSDRRVRGRCDTPAADLWTVDFAVGVSEAGLGSSRSTSRRQCGDCGDRRRAFGSRVQSWYPTANESGISADDCRASNTKSTSWNRGPREATSGLVSHSTNCRSANIGRWVWHSSCLSRCGSAETAGAIALSGSGTDRFGCDSPREMRSCRRGSAAMALNTWFHLSAARVLFSGTIVQLVYSYVRIIQNIV